MSSELDRRDFLAALPGAALAARLARGSGDPTTAMHGLAAAGAAGAATGRVDAIGAQIYTVRNELGRDERGTLAALAEMGYTEVELFGPWSSRGAELRRTLDDLGLRAVSSHVGIDAIRGDWERQLEIAQEHGQDLIVVPSLPRDAQTPEGLRAVADDFNRGGEVARAAGLRLGFHNHDAEMRRFEDGTRPIDILMTNTEPGLLDWQMDIFWTVHGGADPLEELERYEGRVTSVHVKDRTAEGDMVDVGQGVIDFRTILARADEQGLLHQFVEHDRPADAMESMRTSIAGLREVIG